MKLVLRIPEGWTEHAASGGRRLVRLPGGLEIELEAMVAAPDDPRVWIEQTMLRDPPAASKLKEVVPLRARNGLGWPMELAAAELVDAAGNIVEARLGAFYKFQEWAACALVRAKNVTQLVEARGALVDVFETGRPDWNDPTEVATIAELYE